MSAAPLTQAPSSLELERLFEAAPERVFRAWTNPGSLQRWFGPPGIRVESAQVDLRVGGRLRMELSKQGRRSHFLIDGEFREIEFPSRLVFTWVFGETAGKRCKTLIRVEFEQQGEGRTLLRLSQDLLPDLQTLRQQKELMECCLRQLGDFLG